MAAGRFIPIIAIALLLAGGGHAAETSGKPVPASPATPVAPKLTAAERCASLEDQFAAALPLHLTAKKVTSARKLAEDGTTDCTKKRYSLGARRLVDALADLGVTAKL